MTGKHPTTYIQNGEGACICTAVNKVAVELCYRCHWYSLGLHTYQYNGWLSAKKEIPTYRCPCYIGCNYSGAGRWEPYIITGSTAYGRPAKCKIVPIEINARGGSCIGSTARHGMAVWRIGISLLLQELIK